MSRIFAKRWPVFSSYIRLIVHPELLIRAVSRSCLELLGIELKDQWLYRRLSFFNRRWHLKANDGVFLGYS
jgi:hypothetical protein